jgi:hypothetical protein
MSQLPAQEPSVYLTQMEVHLTCELQDLWAVTSRFLTRNLRQVKTVAKQSLQVLSDKPNRGWK